MVSVLDSGLNGPGSSPALCSWARHFTPIVPLSTQVYKWVPANITAGGNPAMNLHPNQLQGGVEILLVASCYGNQDRLWPDGPLGSIADFFCYRVEGWHGERDRDYF